MSSRYVACFLGIQLLLVMPGKIVPAVQKKVGASSESDIVPRVEPGFVSLFNGKTTDGWFLIGKKDRFKVNNRSEIEVSNASGHAYLVHHGDYTDFVLRFRVKHYVNYNSKALQTFKLGDGYGIGVLVRSKPLWNKSLNKDGVTVKDHLMGMSGVMIVTYPSANAYGIIDVCDGSTLKKPNPKVLKAALNPAPDDWNNYEVETMGKSVIIRINGIEIIDTESQLLNYQSVNNLTGFTKIALKVPGHQRMFFRDIRIRNRTQKTPKKSK